jgi:hypothetical protein
MMFFQALWFYFGTVLSEGLRSATYIVKKLKLVIIKSLSLSETI